MYPRIREKIHISVNNNRKNNTVIPQPSKSTLNMNFRDTFRKDSKNFYQLVIAKKTQKTETTLTLKVDKGINSDIIGLSD